MGLFQGKNNSLIFSSIQITDMFEDFGKTDFHTRIPRAPPSSRVGVSGFHFCKLRSCCPSVRGKIKACICQWLHFSNNNPRLLMLWKLHTQARRPRFPHCDLSRCDHYCNNTVVTTLWSQQSAGLESAVFLWTTGPAVWGPPVQKAQGRNSDCHQDADSMMLRAEQRLWGPQVHWHGNPLGLNSEFTPPYAGWGGGVGSRTESPNLALPPATWTVIGVKVTRPG